MAKVQYSTFRVLVLLKEYSTCHVLSHVLFPKFWNQVIWHGDAYRNDRTDEIGILKKSQSRVHIFWKGSIKQAPKLSKVQILVKKVHVLLKYMYCISTCTFLYFSKKVQYMYLRCTFSSFSSKPMYLQKSTKYSTMYWEIYVLYFLYCRQPWYLYFITVIKLINFLNNLKFWIIKKTYSRSRKFPHSRNFKHRSTHPRGGQ